MLVHSSRGDRLSTVNGGELAVLPADIVLLLHDGVCVPVTQGCVCFTTGEMALVSADTKIAELLTELHQLIKQTQVNTQHRYCQNM